MILHVRIYIDIIGDISIIFTHQLQVVKVQEPSSLFNVEHELGQVQPGLMGCWGPQVARQW